MNGTDWTGKNGELNRAEQEALNHGSVAAEQEFEAMLARALRRVDAPEGFAARVVAMAEAEERTKRVAASIAAAEKKHWWQMSGWGWKPVWGAAAAILVAGVLGGHEVHERRMEQERVQASRNFDASVQITDRALEHAREQLKRNGVELDGEQ